ncbi:MAG: hypothetical protein LBR07_06180 [Puniceicoccales bacterium]|nr:hypothetical protein [Puniceicoccales bacterium]
MKTAVPPPLAAVAALLASALLAGGGTPPATVPTTPPPATVPPASFPFSNTEFFVVTAPEDYFSVMRAGDEARALERWFLREFNWNPFEETDRATLVLTPPAEARWTGRVRIEAAPKSLVVRLRWGRATTAGDLRDALARALLFQCGRAAGVAAGEVRVPAWLAAGVAGEIECERNPSLLELLRRRAAAEAPVPLAELTAPAVGSDAAGNARFRRQALWLFRLVRAEIARSGGARAPLAPAVFRARFAELLRGAPLETALAKINPQPAADAAGGSGGIAAGDAAGDAAARALWWPTGFAQVVRGAEAAILSPERSAEVFEELTRFVFADAKGAEDVFCEPAGLFALRERAFVRNEAAARRRLLLAWIPRANPLWHNAWRAYGVFLEQVFAARSAEEAAALWVGVEQERALAREMQAEVAGLLRE